MRRRSLLLLGGAAGLVLVLAVAATLWRDAELRRDHAPERVFPGLIDRVNEVRGIAVESGAESFVVQRTDAEGWILPDLADYPVAPERAKKVLVTLSVLETIEPKTADPDRHGALELNDPTAPEGGAVQVTLLDDAGGALASLLVGRDASATRETRYVRRAGEDQTWLVWRNFDLPARAAGWLDPSLLDIQRWRVKRIEIAHADGGTVEVRREGYDKQHFELLGVPEGFEPSNPFVGNQLGSALERVSMVTIRRAEEVPFPDDAPAARIETFDGMRVEVRTAEVDGVDWLRAEAAYDPSVRQELPEDGPNIVGLPEMPSLEEVEEEVRGLNARLGRWVFAVAPSKREQLSQRLADMIKEKEPPAGEASGG